MAAGIPWSEIERMPLPTFRVMAQRLERVMAERAAVQGELMSLAIAAAFDKKGQRAQKKVHDQLRKKG